MSKPTNKFYPIALAVLCLGLALVPTGCSGKKTNRGYMFRSDWAFEYNRTPWIGCPPDSGCDDERGCGVAGCGGCKDGSCNKGFRRHCGMNPDCTAKKPCCKTLGCGMWINPADPNSFACMGQGVKACGLTPFCSPMKPCGLTPLCGRPSVQNMMAQQPVMLGGDMTYPVPMLPTTTPAATPLMPTPKTDTPVPNTPDKRPPTMAGPGGPLISMGIVPGISTVTGGGVVAAAGVATPVGIMTPSGVQLPGGAVNGQVVIKACMMHPGCSPARPCGVMPGCATLVPVAMVSPNGMALASALSAPGIAGGVIPAYGYGGGQVPGYVNGTVMHAGGLPDGRVGNGMLVNPITGQPISGLSMTGGPQMGYPPIGYTPTGYSPRYPRMLEKEEDEEAEESVEESPITKSQMPVPRFHPVPSKPAFQRSEGLPGAPKADTRKVSDSGRYNFLDEEFALEEDADRSGRIFSKESISTAMQRAYLEGMSDAMDNVEDELDAQAEQLVQTRLQEKILNQAEKLQARIDARQEEQIRQAQFEQAQLRQAELRQKQLRQEQLQQEQYFASQEVRQANFHNAADAPNRIANAADFVKGSMGSLAPAAFAQPIPAQVAPPTARQAAFPQQQAVQRPLQRPAQYPAPVGGQAEFGVIPAARALGNNLFAPLGGLFGSGTTPPPRPMPQAVHGTVAAPQSARPNYRSQAQPVATPRPPQYVVPLCPPRPAVYSDQDDISAEDDIGANMPRRPTAMPKKMKKTIETEDYEEDSRDRSFIQPAHYCEPN